MSERRQDATEAETDSLTGAARAVPESVTVETDSLLGALSGAGASPAPCWEALPLDAETPGQHAERKKALEKACKAGDLSSVLKLLSSGQHAERKETQEEACEAGDLSRVLKLMLFKQHAERKKKALREACWARDVARVRELLPLMGYTRTDVDDYAARLPFAAPPLFPAHRRGMNGLLVSEIVFTAKTLSPKGVDRVGGLLRWREKMDNCVLMALYVDRSGEDSENIRTAMDFVDSITGRRWDEVMEALDRQAWAGIHQLAKEQDDELAQLLWQFDQDRCIDRG